MSSKIIFSLVFLIVVVTLLGIYWIGPFTEVDFGFKERNYNFSLDSAEGDVSQFYPNMRFPTPNISYKIDDCPLNKKEDMKRAFEIMSEKTMLSFYTSQTNEEIYVTCDSGNKIEGRLFIAGEGGPTNITQTSNFNVIKSGAITLIRESSCATPNVGIHELLHVLGFDHSPNPNNIMYEVSRCDQEISQDILNTINNLYSTPSFVDLSIDNASASMHGRYLDASLTVINNGLKDSKDSILEIYADDKLIKEFDVEELEIGFGSKITLKNILVLKLSVNELRFVINYSEEELDKENNEMVLIIKK